MTDQRDPAELFVQSYIKLLRAHGEAYPGAAQDADELEAAWEAETTSTSGASEGTTVPDTTLTEAPPSA